MSVTILLITTGIILAIHLYALLSPPDMKLQTDHIRSWAYQCKAGGVSLSDAFSLVLRRGIDEGFTTTYADRRFQETVWNTVCESYFQFHLVGKLPHF